MQLCGVHMGLECLCSAVVCTWGWSVCAVVWCAQGLECLCSVVVCTGVGVSVQCCGVHMGLECLCSMCACIYILCALGVPQCPNVFGSWSFWHGCFTNMAPIMCCARVTSFARDP